MTDREVTSLMTRPTATSSPLFLIAAILGAISLVIIPVNLVQVSVRRHGETLFLVLAAIQIVFGLIAAVLSLIQYIRSRGLAGRGWAIAVGIVGALVGVGGIVSMVLLGLLLVAVAGAGGAWGRPLRLRGKILHPSLRQGSDWTRGARPDVSRLDKPTRAALEALWLHDAQKEHASVPAFSRISWMLAAVGAPAELMEGAHQAAMEEIDHTRRCFALAAGYGGRSHSVEPMPDLLLGGLDIKGDPLVYLAVESLKDGCLLEDFNADVAGECERACQDPATKDVLARIVREERSHAEFSWQMLDWLLARGGEKVRRAIVDSIAGLAKIERPTSADAQKQALVELADPAALRAHGRLRDEEWAALWTVRLEATRERAEALIKAPVVRLAPRPVVDALAS